jgi:hypothetical protein
MFAVVHGRSEGRGVVSLKRSVLSFLTSTSLDGVPSRQLLNVRALGWLRTRRHFPGPGSLHACFVCLPTPCEPWHCSRMLLRVVRSGTVGAWQHRRWTKLEPHSFCHHRRRSRTRRRIWAYRWQRQLGRPSCSHEPRTAPANHSR